MSQAVSKIKSRINTVTGAYKVTSAMKLVSNVKLKQWKNKMLGNKEYIDLTKQTIDMVLCCSEKNNSKYLVRNDSDIKLYIIVSSTLGLCGSYNSNIFKIAEANITEKDSAIILGGKGVIHFKNGEFTKLDLFNSYSSLQDKDLIDSVSKYVLSEYENNHYGEIHLIYSEYKNSMVFLAKDLLLLPLESEQKDEFGYLPLMEPSQKELIEKLVPIYIRSLIHSKFLESSVCEVAARSNAMENATKNAEEILDELKIEFNKARQNAITQEIVEIVSASKAV